MPNFKTNLRWGAAILGYYFWFQALYNSIRFGSMFPYADVSSTLTGFAYNLPPILTVFLLNILIVFKIVKIRNMTLKVLCDVVLSALAMMGVNFLYTAVLILLGRNANVDWSGTILNDIIILLAVEMVYYYKRLINSHKETEEAQKRALQYQYDSLKSQINPHFLFNALNILHSLVSIDPLKSQVFIRELARMYRYIMAKQNCVTVTVNEEFAFLDSYISVLKMRYNNKFDVEIKGDMTEVGDKYLIPFTMQLLLENVTKHNVISTNSPMIVSIIISNDGIEIINPIRPRPSESVSRIGLRYLTKLYSTHHGDFRTDNDGKTFTAHIPYI